MKIKINTASIGLLLWGSIQVFLTIATISLASDEASSGSNFTTVSTPEQSKEKWKKLTPSEKEALRKTYREWQALPPARKAELQSNFKKFQSLPSETRERVIKNYQAFQKLTPADQNKVRKRFVEFKQLPQAEQRRRLENLKRKSSSITAPKKHRHR